MSGRRLLQTPLSGKFRDRANSGSGKIKEWMHENRISPTFIRDRSASPARLFVTVNTRVLRSEERATFRNESLVLENGALYIPDQGQRPSPLKAVFLVVGASFVSRTDTSFCLQDARQTVQWEVQFPTAELAEAWGTLLEGEMNAPRPSALAAGSLDLANWMGQLRHVLGPRSVCDIAMPGCHDAATYGMDVSKAFIPCYKGLPRAMQKYVKRDAVDWSRAQRDTLRHQLAAGNRYFDLRIAVEGDGSLWTCHGLFSNPLAEVLEDAAAFLREHPAEVILLDVQELHEQGYCADESHSASPSSCAALVSLVERVLGPLAVPFGARPTVTLDELLATPHRVLICHNHSNPSAFPDPIWFRTHTLRSDWKDKSIVDELFVALNEEVEHNRPQGRFWVLQAVLTPTPMQTIKAHIPRGKEPSSLVDCANLLRPQLLHYLSTFWRDKGLGIVMMDVSEDRALNEIIVQLNAR